MYTGAIIYESTHSYHHSYSFSPFYAPNVLDIYVVSYTLFSTLILYFEVILEAYNEYFMLTTE